MSVVFPALSRPCCFEFTVCQYTDKESSDSSSLPDDDREKERKRSTTRKRERKKRRKEKEAPKSSVDRKKSAQTYQKQDLRVFLPQPQGGENVVEPIERPHDDSSIRGASFL